MIRVDTIEASQQLQELKNQLSGAAINKAMARSINRTITHEKSESKKATRKKYNFPKDVLDNFYTYTANPGKLEGKLAANSKPTPINRLGAAFLGFTNPQRKGGVVFFALKGKTSQLPFAFMTRPDGPVFARGAYKKGGGFQKGNARKPIAKLVTLSLYQAIAGQIPRVALNDDSLKFYNKTFMSELNYQLSLVTKKSQVRVEVGDDVKAALGL